MQATTLHLLLLDCYQTDNKDIKMTTRIHLGNQMLDYHLTCTNTRYKLAGRNQSQSALAVTLAVQLRWQYLPGIVSW